MGKGPSRALIERVCHGAVVAGGQNRRGALLPAFVREAAAARAAARARAFCWVQGPEREPGPWPGVVARWLRQGDGWSAVVVYVVTDAEDEWRVVSAVLPARRLRAASDP